MTVFVVVVEKVSDEDVPGIKGVWCKRCLV